VYSGPQAPYRRGLQLGLVPLTGRSFRRSPPSSSSLWSRPCLHRPVLPSSGRFASSTARSSSWRPPAAWGRITSGQGSSPGFSSRSGRWPW
jgi:hypothetical protein